MVTLNKGQWIAARLLGISEVTFPSDFILLVFLIKNVSRMNIILNYNFSTAVLQKFLPGSRDFMGILGCLEGCSGLKKGGSHVDIVQGEDCEEN